MTTCLNEEIDERRVTTGTIGRRFRLLAVLLGPFVLFACPAPCIFGQTEHQKALLDQVQKLTDAMARAQAQLEQSQQQLIEMRAQLAALQRQVVPSSVTPEISAPAAAESTPSASSQASASLAAAVQDLRERLEVQNAEIATQEQTKVESESKYPVKVTGLLLLNGFANTKAVDMPATPTLAVAGSGSSGGSFRQTVLGIDARGPHVFGARTYADLRVDFSGSPAAANSTGGYSGYYSGATLLRLRTAHAGLQWQDTNVNFSLDRPIISPGAPTSLIAVAVPALAWSGNLWTWNPQVTFTQDLNLSSSSRLRIQSALVDVADAPLSPLAQSTGNSGLTQPTAAEQSRWPGVEARVALWQPAGRGGHEGGEIGFGGYFAPHDSAFLGRRFDSWAGTLDSRLFLPGRLEFSGSFYRGQALGGLGGGAYKDFAYRMDSDSTGYYSRVLDDVGGWAQLKERLSERIEMNAAFGIDNAFAHELRRYNVPGGSAYENLARNRTYTGNVIYSPTAWLLFSLEYRHLISSPITGLPAESDILGLGAGYRF